MNFKVFHIGAVNTLSIEDSKTVEELIAAQNYCVVATSSKTSVPRVSALSHFPGQSLQEICFATDSNSDKIKNMLENPLCEIMYTDGNGQVILTGKMEVCTDSETKRAKWLDHMIGHFPDGPDGTFCVLKFTPLSVRAMIM